MKLYAEYIYEREGAHLITLGKYAFCTYKIYNKGVYIVDIFVAKDLREKGIATILLNMVKNIAKDLKKPAIYGSACKDANGFEASVRVLEKSGFKHFKTNKNMIYYKLEEGL